MSSNSFNEGNCSSMTSTPPPPPTSQSSTDDLESSSVSEHTTTTFSFNDLQQQQSSEEEEMSSSNTNLVDMELPSSFPDYKMMKTSRSSSYSEEEDDEFMQNVDLGEEEEEEASQSLGTTHRAICNDPARRDSRRRRPLKSQTPKEQYCCCCSMNDDDDIDYDPNVQLEFQSDNSSSCCIQLLRYCRLVPPRPEERLIKRKIRFLLWWTILLDLTVALVSLLTFISGPASSSILTCCGEPIFDVPGMDLEQVMHIFVWAYLGVVILEILPVVREGCWCIPWNLMNPIVGFALGFVLFFWNDAPMAALCTWILQIVSVALEFVTLRHYSILLKESKQRLERVEQQQQQKKNKPRRAGGYQQSKQDRDQRELRSRHAKALLRWRKHMIGVTINVLLAIATLLLIVYVARRGGMCIQDGGTPSLFVFNEENEMECTKASEGRRYETCDLDLGETECYFPFF